MFTIERKGYHRLEYAEEVVVVKNFEPEKARNRLEDKTQRISCEVMVVYIV